MKTVRLHRFLSLGLLGAALLASCGKEDPQTPRGPVYTGDRLVSISPTLADENWLPVKADYDPIDNTLLQSKGFGVYAYYTGTEDYSAAKDSSAYNRFGLVYNNREFYYDAGTWKYNGKDEFWPSTAGEKLSFFAYAPYDTWHNKVTYDGKVNTIKYDDYVAQSLSETELQKQRDILWGTNTSGLPHKNVWADQYATPGTVDMHFRHAVAKVRFLVQGSLPGEVLSYISSTTPSTSSGAWGEETPAESEAEKTMVEGDPVNNITRRDGSRYEYYYYYFTCTQRQTQTESFKQYRYSDKTQSRTARYSTEGRRYLIDHVSFKGFNQKGTLVLDNTAAYSPLWTNVEVFSGSDPEYVLNKTNVLTPSLRNVSASDVRSNFGTYTGVTETPTDLMDGYFLYAIPKIVTSEADQVAVSLSYDILNVSGSMSAEESRTNKYVQSRTVTRTRTRQRVSDEYGRDYSSSPNASVFTYSSDWSDWSDWGAWQYGDWSSESVDTEGEWKIGSMSLLATPAPTVEYTGSQVALNGKILTSFQGGRAYDIKLILAGDKIELDVVPRPWELEETSFDYTSNINDVIQALTYDSSYIDYADARGNVYINNRMGKFYFRLGTGKYIAWQAALVGDAAFGFTDENGNFLLDTNGERVSSIRGSVDPDVTNYIYVKALNSSATVTSRAKLRIYYIDSNSDVTAAMNLVNVQGVNEWTIVQNAN